MDKRKKVIDTYLVAGTTLIRFCLSRGGCLARMIFPSLVLRSR